MRTKHLIAVVLLLALGCSRTSKGPSKVTVVVPPKSVFQSVGAMSATLADMDCIAVMVSTPDTTVSPNTCELESGTTFITMKPIGPFAFLNSSSQKIDITLDRGVGRVIRLIGYKTSNGLCAPDLEDVIDPHVLGSSPSLTIAGTEMNVSLNVTVDPDYAIGECDGPDFGEGGGSDGPYLRVEGLYQYDKGENPTTAKPLTRGVCYPVSFMTYEPCSGGGACTIRTPATSIPITLANNNVKFYSSAASCENNSVTISSITMTAGTSPGTHATPTYTAYMRIPLDRVGVISTDLSGEVSVPAGADSEFTMPEHSFFEVGSPVVNVTGLTHAAGSSFTAAQLPLGGCTATTTTIGVYPAGSLASDFTAGNLLQSHEPFTLTNAGLRLKQTCAGADEIFSNTSGSVTGYVEQLPAANLGPTGGSVRKSISVAVAPNAGKYILVGSWGTLSGLTYPPIARFYPSGEIDGTFQPPAFNNEIYDVVEMPDGKLIVAGAFTNVGGESHSGLARLYPDGKLDSSFSIQVTGSSVRALAVNGSKLYFGGDFSDVDGTTRNNLASVDLASSAVTAWDPNVNQLVTSLLISTANDALYVGGYFTVIGGMGRNHLASFVLSTGVLSNWDTDVNSYVFSLSGDATFDVIATGVFTAVDALAYPRNMIVAYSGSDAEPTLATLDFDSTGFSPTSVHTARRVGSYIYLGGDLQHPTLGNLVRIPLAGGAPDATYDSDVDEIVKGIQYIGGDLLVVGDFSTVGGMPANRFVTVDTNNGARFGGTMNPLKSSLFLNPLYFNMSPIRSYRH